MVQKKNSVLIRNKRVWIEGNRKNHELSSKLGCEITHRCAMKGAVRLPVIKKGIEVYKGMLG